MSQQTIRRTQINRANSQNSTGPKTEAGKQQSSLNALRHGLTSQLVVIPGEDVLVYQSHLKSFTDEYKPQGATESHLVQALADSAWRQNRIAVLEANLLTAAAAGQASPLDGAPAQDAMKIVAALETQAKVLSNLSLHSQRLSREFERNVTQLRQLQKSRRFREDREDEDLLNIMEMYQAKGQPYVPANDGFVFTQARLDAAIRTRNRERQVSKAFAFRFAA